jgi:hypothetical protein
MRPLLLLAASTMALGAAGCAPKTPPVRAALDCPMRQGDLTRTSASPDGKVCTYSTSGGAEVTLQLVSTQGGVDNALANIETNLLAGRVKPAEEDKDGKAADGKPADGKAAVAADDAKADAAAAVTDGKADKAAREAADDAEKAGVQIETKDGRTIIHTQGEDADGNVRVNLPGVHIVANENDDTAQVSVGPIHIDAGGDGATIRMRRDVRLRGEALSRNRRGMRATFIYTGEDLPDGYRFVGYEAGGPKAGPITVAIVKSKSEGPNGNELYPDVKRLVRKNGGV